MPIQESIESFKKKYGKYFITTILPVFIAIFGTAFAVFQYYESVPDLKVEVESIQFTGGNESLIDRKVDIRSVKTIVDLHSDSSSRTIGDKALLPYLISIKELNEFIGILDTKIKSIEKDEIEISKLSENISIALDESKLSYVEAKKIFESDLAKSLIVFVGQSIFSDSFEYRRFRSFDGAVNLIKSRKFEFNADEIEFKRVAPVENGELDEEIELLIKLVIEKYVSDSSLKDSEPNSDMDESKNKKKKNNQEFDNDNAVNQLLLASKTLLPKFISQTISIKKERYKDELRKAQEIYEREKDIVDKINNEQSRLEVSSIIMNLGSQGTAVRPYGVLRIQLNANSRITIPLSVENRKSTNVSSSGVTKVVFYSDDRHTSSKLLEKVDGAMSKDVESVLILQDIQGETHSSKRTHISYQTFKESIIEELTVEAHKAGF